MLLPPGTLSPPSHVAPPRHWQCTCLCCSMLTALHLAVSAALLVAAGTNPTAPATCSGFVAPST